MIFYISEDIESIVEERQKGENPLRRAFLELRSLLERNTLAHKYFFINYF